MPLIKSASPKALKKNIETEMRANPGKSHRDQNLAIAFATQRSARKKGKKMADGGQASDNDDTSAVETGMKSIRDAFNGVPSPKPSPTPAPSRQPASAYSTGGEVDHPSHGGDERGRHAAMQVNKHHSDPMGHDKSAHCYMCGGGPCKMALGGTVELSDHGMKRIKTSDDSAKEVVRTAGGSLVPREAFARGGEVMSDEQASTESRPMPDDTHRDEEDVHFNSTNKPLRDSDWTGRPTVAQAQNMNREEMSEPSTPRTPMGKRLHDEQDDHMSTASPHGYGRMAPSEDLEEGPDRSGPMVPDEERQHSNGRSPYASGGSVAQHASNDDEDTYNTIAEQIMGKRRRAKMMADGGMIDDDDDSLETPAMLSPYDEDNAVPIKKELYDVHQLSDQPEDSNEISPEHDEMDVDDADIVSRIRRSMKKQVA